jgi:hypothetical protein
MVGHDTLPDGTCIPVQGPEKGLPHSFFSKTEIDALFRGQYSNLNINLDDHGRWIITGQKRAYRLTAVSRGKPQEDQKEP